MIEESGGRWRWATEKEVRRSVASPSHQRPATFSGKLPVIHVDECQVWISDPALVHMLFDGVTPRTIARTLVANGKRLQALGASGALSPNK